MVFQQCLVFRWAIFFLDDLFVSLPSPIVLLFFLIDPLVFLPYLIDLLFSLISLFLFWWIIVFSYIFVCICALSN